MLGKPPPSRYSVKEKGGRLIVIDNETGLPPLSASDRLAGIDYPEMGEADSPFEAATIAARDLNLDISEPFSPRSTSHPVNAQFAVRQFNKQGRLILLIVIGLFALAFIIVSGAWVIVGLALMIAPVRSVMWAATKRGVSQFLTAESVS
jgi:hypothetical protein